MTIQLGETYTINWNKYICTKESGFMVEFISHNHETVPETITIFLGTVIRMVEGPNSIVEDNKKS